MSVLVHAVFRQVYGPSGAALMMTYVAVSTTCRPEGVAGTVRGGYESLFLGLVKNAAHRLLGRPSYASVSMMGPERSPLGSYSECFPPR